MVQQTRHVDSRLQELARHLAACDQRVECRVAGYEIAVSIHEDGGIGQVTLEYSLQGGADGSKMGVGELGLTIGGRVSRCQ
jgi:hypothetical protein